ncbi:hypothetical protein Tco_0428830, partial [Tanacetum coccineum]
VRIVQKSQENGQSRTNTDTGTDRVHKSRKFLAKGLYHFTPGWTCIDKDKIEELAEQYMEHLEHGKEARKRKAYRQVLVYVVEATFLVSWMVNGIDVIKTHTIGVVWCGLESTWIMVLPNPELGILPWNGGGMELENLSLEALIILGE